MDKQSSTIHLQRLKQLDAYFGTEATVVDSQTLAEIMSCSTRNVAKIMKNLNELGWITWIPGKGRGNKTQLKIEGSFHERLCSVLKGYVANGELSEASRYADIFKYGNVFKQHLPEWLTDVSDDNVYSDELISLIPYCLPRCHPKDMTDRNAGVFVNAMFDTLIKYDAKNNEFTPHLAHQFYQEGLTYYFRIRPDVYFHNGELVTPQHIKQNLTAHQNNNSVAHQLYANIASIHINCQWVEVTLEKNDPMFLHTLADIHAAIYLDNPAEPDYPYGTGAYYWEYRNQDHWSLLKNLQYFGTHGVLKRADFWHVISSKKTSVGHLFEFEDVEDTKDSRDRHYATMGTKTLCISHRLDLNARSAIQEFVQHVLHKFYAEQKKLTHTVLPSRTSQIAATTEPPRPHELPSQFRVLELKQDPLQLLWYELRNTGVQIEFVASIRDADIWIDNFLFGSDVVLDHYYWLLLSQAAEHMLTPFRQRQWLTEFQQATCSKSEFLNRIEDQYLKERRLVPLWIKSIAYKSHQTLRGTKVDSLGMMTLTDIWFDKRNSQ
ncbi:SgrR family transcriptional regulator [Vibrio gallicus]|uniref:SgrR family transcriptional regulator n=1 Tax=Vibrio gallicus TaxID=190897 RepID=UPI0021C46A34|nr:SgrR family transcriptional regulator [Vibrio gallicus]